MMLTYSKLKLKPKNIDQSKILNAVVWYINQIGRTQEYDTVDKYEGNNPKMPIYFDKDFNTFFMKNVLRKKKSNSDFNKH